MFNNVKYTEMERRLNKPVDGLKQPHDAIYGVKFEFSRLLDSGVGVKLDGILFNM